MTGRPSQGVIDHAAAILGRRCVRDRPLGPLTTYRVGGPAALFLELEVTADLDAVHRAVAETALPMLVVGRGSNLLVADGGFSGIAITLGQHYDQISFINLDRATQVPGPVADQLAPAPGSAARLVRAGGGTYLPVLARRCAAAGIGGLEWAVGIPGSLGGGVCMNAGGHGGDINGVLVSAMLYDLEEGQARSVGVEDLGFGYRRSSLTSSQVVIEATLAGEPADPERSRARIAEIVRWRREHQPGGANAGSVFVNPDGDTAGRLVEAVGCKGFRIGSAQVSARHANFIQSDQGGSADDIASLIGEVRRRVADQTGIRLRLECRVAGDLALTSSGE